MATLTQYDNGGSYTPEQLAQIYDSIEVYSISSTLIRFRSTIGNFEGNVYGNGFAFDSYGYPTGGTVTGMDERLDGGFLYTLSGFSVPLTTFLYASEEALEAAIFAGADTLNGAPTYDDDLRGYAGNDVIFGNGGNDRLDGGTGDDAMAGGKGDDVYVVDSAGDSVTEVAGAGIDQVISAISYVLDGTLENLALSGRANINGTGNDLRNIITGNGGTNKLWGYGGNDVISGYSGADVIDGGTGNDMLDGGAGNDTLIGGTGADRMAGGADNDTYYVDSAGDEVVELPYGGRDLVFSSITLALSAGVENLTLTGNQAIDGTGNDEDNTITGNEADNELSGGGGTNEIYGGGGNDTLRGGGGINFLYGGAGDDTYYETLNVHEEENEGIDTLIVSFSSHFILPYNVENLILTGAAVSWTGNELDNTIIGNDLDNTLSGHFGHDTIYGGGGDDLIFANGSTLYGGQGNDRYIATSCTIVELAGEGIDYVQSETDTVLGDNIENLGVGITYGRDVNGTGNALNNVITGSGGKNRLDGAAGADTLIGWGGADTYVVDNAGDTIQETGGRDIDSVISSISWTLGDYVENLTLTGSASRGTGNAATNFLTGNGAANVLLGLAGNDRLDGGAGSDLMQGGAGNDIYYVDSTGDRVVEAANEGSDLVNSSVGFVLGADVEQLTLTGAAAINGRGNALANRIIGNDAANQLTGADGNDDLRGGGGDDRLDGGVGDDLMQGGAGNDVYYVDRTSDRVVEAAGQGMDVVTSSAGFVLGADVENLFLTGTAAANGRGNAQANRIVGNDAANQLTGGEGNDDLRGGGGNDRLDGGVGDDLMQGGAGNDAYYVDTIGDSVIEAADGGTDIVSAGVSFTLGGGVEKLILTGSAGLEGTGNGLANSLTGNAGANILSGLGGRDLIEGGRGNDTLSGGEAGDCFIFGLSEGPVGRDRIMDFEDGLDRVKLEGGPNSFESFLAGGGQIVAGGADVVVFLDPERQNYIRLVGVDLSQISAADFLFA